jgi:hypothetical protein
MAIHMHQGHPFLPVQSVLYAVQGDYIIKGDTMHEKRQYCRDPLRGQAGDPDPLVSIGNYRVNLSRRPG